MTEDPLRRKKHLKWFYSRTENFNNSVPYLVKSLSTCKNNIRKQYRLENFAAVRQERIAAERTIRNLQQLLIDIDGLRQQVIDSDLGKFDKLVNQSRERIVTALNNFNQYYESLSLGNKNTRNKVFGATTYNPSYGSIDRTNSTSDPNNEENSKQILLQMQDDKWVIENQIEVARKMERIEEDSQGLNEMFQTMAEIINNQRENVDKIEDYIEDSHSQVVSARQELAQVAAKMQGTVYPLLGALLGTCIGGPIGFLAGIKVGSLVAVTGSVVGFSGGQVLKYRQQKVQKEINESEKREDDLLIKNRTKVG